MADMLATGEAWLEARRTAYMTRTVKYAQGAYSVDVLATIGRTEFAVDREYEGSESWEARDFIVLAADLVLNGASAKPIQGDTIVDTTATRIYTYAVMPPPGAESAWRYSDGNRNAIRIHTKLITEAAVP